MYTGKNGVACKKWGLSSLSKSLEMKGRCEECRELRLDGEIGEMKVERRYECELFGGETEGCSVS